MKKKDQNTETPPWEGENVTHEAAEATLKAAKKKTRKEGSSDTARRPRWKPSLLGYSWVMKNISFFLFLAALAVVYIYNGHYADKISRDINRTSKELKELQYEYKTLKSEVMFRSKQSELAKAVDPFGLKQLAQPPYVLVDSVHN
ncbi:MAG TPA: FtsL-like putative cell division protein [Puia sp.]|nr:FtsL-like putative cell division protein [Puia sp.]